MSRLAFCEIYFEVIFFPFCLPIINFHLKFVSKCKLSLLSVLLEIRSCTMISHNIKTTCIKFCRFPTCCPTAQACRDMGPLGVSCGVWHSDAGLGSFGLCGVGPLWIGLVR